MRTPALLPLLLVLAACTDRTDGGAAAGIPFLCGDTRVVARFQGDAMVLRLDRRDYRLTRQISGSGGRYAGGSGANRIEFWTKGDEAMLTRGGQALPTCRAVPAP